MKRGRSGAAAQRALPRAQPDAGAPAAELDPVEPVEEEAEPEIPEPTAPSKLAQLHPGHFFMASWRWIDAVAARDRQRAGRAFDWHPVWALCAGAVCLTLMEYFGGRRDFERIVLAGIRVAGVRLIDPVPGLVSSPWYELWSYAYWSGWRFVGYFVLPAIVVRLVFRTRLRDFGLETRGFSEHVWIYAVLYLIVLGPVIGVSFTHSFQTHYPFYDQAQRSWFDFLVWELLYALQFFSLEFFFRGFLVQALRRSMGSYAIFAMVAPYCMIHFGKPILETLGAILAGVALGTLALRTRSIWAGFLIHVSVAVTMDIASLLQGKGLPSLLWPHLR